MAEGWYSALNDELKSVDAVIMDEVRTAYPELNDMCEDTLSARNHELRPALCILSYYANGGKDRTEAVRISACFQTVFDGLHLHDRINGEGKVMVERKRLFSKEPSTTKVIVAGDFMYVMGFRQAYAHSPGLVPYLMKVSASISDGIFLFVDHEHDPEVTEEVCMGILDMRRAVEFQILMESAAKLGGGSLEDVTRMNRCGQYIGRAVELMMEMEDLYGSKEVKKPPMDSLIAGYPTLPIYYAMQDARVGPKIKEAFADRQLGPKEAAEAVAMIKQTNSSERCRAHVAECRSKAVSLIKELPDSDYKTMLLAFTDTLVI